MRFLIILFLGLSLYAQSLYFLPFEAKAAKIELLRKIDHANHEITVAIYSFTHKTIAKHLKKAAKRGVHVLIIADEEQNTNNPYSQIGYLQKYKNIDVYTIKGKYNKKRDYFGKMHMKLAIIDQKWLIFGSANWSYSAFSKNYEMLYFVKDYALAKKAKKMFERVLRKAKPY
ncbi:phospholipase D-like domain-containing protein [Nitratiruptor sp. SB155-2]|uniref:phospholipase D-like domain-containing protein n=1 Tax=Nitratiruptor sp. (strain SB155-2) TaxID=387092 RepID=UPI0001587150|nr:phospholipase D-like domain-containing protein [Nitratiruptor sp. SB155-2]BAF70606.1 membrane bound endonuclease [Nitratiruptor sp. SB155-2]